tara:strand:+ start:1193 stop:3241 length:2049 start_codon:yes stop_codon:yes gene_type:complete
MRQVFKRLLLVLLLCVPFGLATEHLAEVDFTDPVEVNSLSVVDIAASIEDGNLADLQLVNDWNMATIINDRPDLFFSDSVLRAEVDRRAQIDIDFINGDTLQDPIRPSLLHTWLGQFGIDTVENAWIVAYDGKKITTFNRAAVFDVRELQKYLEDNGGTAYIDSDGTLVINDGMIIRGEFTSLYKRDSALVTFADGVITVEKGRVELDGGFLPVGTRLVMKPGAVLDFDSGDQVFTSGKEFLVTILQEDQFSVEGRNVVLKEFDKKYSFTKKIHINLILDRDEEGGPTLVEDTLVTVPAGSSFSEYLIEINDHKITEHRIYTVSGDTPVQVIGDTCPPVTNCITTHKLKDDKAAPVIRATSVEGDFQIDLGRRVRFVEAIPSGEEGTVRITRNGRGVRVDSVGGVDPLRSSNLLQLPQIKVFPPSGSGDEVTLVKNGRITRCEIDDCRNIASSRSSGRRGKIVHLAAARLDGQQSTRKAARKNGIRFVGYEAMNMKVGDVQRDLEDAQIVAMSGHHYGAETKLWGEGGEFKLEDLPPSESVEAVTFSACNTIKNTNNRRRDPVLRTLDEKYPNLKVVFGYNTKAPLYDGEVWEEAIPLIQKAVDRGDFGAVKRMVTQRGIIGYSHGVAQKLGVYIKEDGAWNFCELGGCKALPIVVATLPAVPSRPPIERYELEPEGIVSEN